MAITDPAKVPVHEAPMSAEQERWLQEAWGRLDQARLAELITDLVNIPSPTGEEGEAARYAVGAMRQSGLDASYQPITDLRGNAIGWLRGAGTGADLLIYGHFDHYISGADDDTLVTGDLEHPSFHSRAIREDNVIMGAGSGNPKGGCAVAIHAAEAVRAAGITLLGNVAVGLVSGGIHKSQLPNAGRPYVGHRYEGMAAGCDYMLKHGLRPDYCISTKPGYSVIWEEPGVLWIKLTVKGVIGYAARRGVYRRPIEDAAAIIPELSDWFEAYADRHAVGQVGTPAHIGAIEGGWPFKPDFSPAVCNLYLDIRVSPDDDVRDVMREFGEFVDGLKAARPELELAWETFSAVPGTRTDPENWVVQSCMRAWETVEGKPHVARSSMSGMTDAAILRQWGVPVARLGGQLDRGRDPSLGFLSGEGADLDNLIRLARCYVYTIIDTCTRTRAELM